jgi:hypothetical protein
MGRFPTMFALAIVLGAAPALSQVTGGSQPGAVVESPRLVVLSPETQAMVREHVKRSDLPVAKLSEPARIDMFIPEEVELLAMPQDMATETPTTTSYRYLITTDVIAVVEPQSRKVIQLITR